MNRTGLGSHTAYFKLNNLTTPLTDKAIAVQVPEGVVTLDYEQMHDDGWRILGRASELSEEQWKGIVEGWHFGTGKLMKAEVNSFKDYSGNNNSFTTAAESGLSLLRSLKLDPKTSLILIRE